MTTNTTKLTHIFYAALTSGMIGLVCLVASFWRDSFLPYAGISAGLAVGSATTARYLAEEVQNDD